MDTIKLKEGQEVIDKDGNIYLIEKGDMVKTTTLNEGYNVKSLAKEMEKISLKLFRDFDESPEWKVKKVSGGLEIQIEPNTNTGEDVDYDDYQDFVDTVVETTGFGGYKTGYGGWILSDRYKSDEYDFNNPASKSHY